MTHYKLTQYIIYKAVAKGIRVAQINERGSSHTCSRCGLSGYRSYQGTFECKNCDCEVNADYNGAKNTGFIKST